VLRAALLLETVTTEPPAGAEEDRVTVHVELAPEATLVGEHCRAETVGRTACTVMVPPVPETAKALPSANAARSPSANGTVELLVAESVTLTTATTPLPMELAFIPEATHIVDPLVVLQLIVFPAAVSAGPLAKLMAVTLVGAYESVHCKAAG
jgi:hypothetical protein